MVTEGGGASGKEIQNPIFSINKILLEFIYTILLMPVFFEEGGWEGIQERLG